MADFGVSFVPTDQNGGNPRGTAGGPAPAPLQQAIQMLSLRLPRIVGSQGLAPGPLLNSPGGGGLADILKALFGQGHLGAATPFGRPMGAPGASPMGAPPPMGIPAPHVIPGQDGPAMPGPSDASPAPSAPPPDVFDRSTPGGTTPSGPYQQSVRNPSMGYQLPITNRDWLGAAGKNY